MRAILNNIVRSILFPTLVVAAATLVGFAQGTAITKNDFESTIDRAKQLVQQQVRRERIESKEFSNRNKPADEISSVIEEYVPNGGYRRLTKTTEGGKSSQDEVIIVDFKYYSRSGNGPWSVRNGGIGDDPSPVPDDIEQKYSKIDKTILDGKTVSVYKSIIKFPKSRYGDEPIPETFIEQYWITKDGLFAKTTLEIEYVGTKKFYGSTTTYEYDSNIKIEAPIK